MSDAAGTMWLDVAKRDWSEAMLDACHLTREHMPTLFEGSEITGTLQSAIAERWNMPAVPVVAGGGDNAAGAVGVGMVDAGGHAVSRHLWRLFCRQRWISQQPGKRGAQFLPCAAGKWHLMSVMLSAASCWTGRRS